MIFLTILNTVAIIYLLAKQSKFYIRFSTDTSWHIKTVVAYKLELWKSINDSSAKGVYTLRLPIRNKQKIEKQEEIDRLLKMTKPQRLQMLTSTFSWLKTKKEVLQFEKDYSIVDKEIVTNLVTNFKEKHNG